MCRADSKRKCQVLWEVRYISSPSAIVQGYFKAFRNIHGIKDFRPSKLHKVEPAIVHTEVPQHSWELNLLLLFNFFGLTSRSLEALAEILFWIVPESNVSMPGAGHLKCLLARLSQLWSTGPYRIHSLWGVLAHQLHEQRSETLFFKLLLCHEK